MPSRAQTDKRIADEALRVAIAGAVKAERERVIAAIADELSARAEFSPIAYTALMAMCRDLLAGKVVAQ